MTIKPWKVIETTHPRKHLRVDRCELDEVIRMAKAGELLQSMHVSALFYALAHLQRIG
jgi:hypothetical protein